MKNKFLYIVATFCVISAFITGCASKPFNNSMSVSPDWPSYNSAEEIINASKYVYSGTVTDISFEIIDYVTGKVDNSPDSDSTSRALYTVYTVSVAENYKGESPAETKVKVMGGLSGYREEEQKELMVSSKLLPDGSVGFAVEGVDVRLQVGCEYLFCTNRSESGFDRIINPQQFSHAPDSETAKNIIELLK